MPDDQIEPVQDLTTGMTPAQPEAEADESYPNEIDLPEGLLADAADGDEVSAQIKGVIVEREDGSRCLEVSEINGQPVSGEAEEPETAQDAEASLDEELGRMKKIQQTY